MITHILDTSVFAQPLRRPAQRVMSAMQHWADLGDARLSVSVVAHAETAFGVHSSGSRRMQLQFEQMLADRLPIVDTDRDVWAEFARMKSRQLRLGLRISDLDLLIAASAHVHRLIVATLNRRDFSRIENLNWEDWSV